MTTQEEGSTGTVIQTALLDENNTFRFKVPDGDYEVTIDGAYYDLEPKKISISTDTPIITQPLKATEKALAIDGCKVTEYHKAINTASQRGNKQATYALNLFNKYMRAAKKLPKKGVKEIAALQKLANKIDAGRSSLNSAVLGFPLMQVSCNGKSGCSTNSYTTQLRKALASINAIDKNANMLFDRAKILLKGVASVDTGALSKGAAKLHSNSKVAINRLPMQSDSCK